MASSFSLILVFILFLILIVPNIVILILIYSFFRNNRTRSQQSDALIHDLMQTNKELLSETTILKEKINNIEKMLKDVA